MPRLFLSLLGGFEARIQPANVLLRLPTRKSEALLAYLVARSEIQHRRDYLSALLWSDAPSVQARHSLRQTLTNLRATLRPYPRELFRTVGDAISVDTTGIRLDTYSLEQILSRRRTPRAIAVACALYRGDFLQGLNVPEPEFEAWVGAERARLSQLGIEAHERYLRHLLAAGDPTGAMQAALRLVALDPLLEWAHRALIRLYMQRGQFSAALKQHTACVRILTRELGVEPEAETKQLGQELLEVRTQKSRPAGGELPAHELTATRPGVSVSGRWRRDEAPDPPRERWHQRRTYD